MRALIKFSREDFDGAGSSVVVVVVVVVVAVVDLVVVKVDVQFDLFSSLQMTISSSDLSSCNATFCAVLQ